MIALVTPTISVNEHMFGPALLFRMQIRVRDTEFAGQSNRPRDCERISCSMGVNPAFYFYVDPRGRKTRDAYRRCLDITPIYVAVISPKWATDLTLMISFFERVIQIQTTQRRRKKLWCDLDLHLTRIMGRLEIVSRTRNPTGAITTVPDITQLRFVDEYNTEGGHDECGVCPESSGLSTPSDQI